MKVAATTKRENDLITIRELALICFVVSIAITLALYWLSLITPLGCAISVTYLIASVLLLSLHNRDGSLRI